MMITGTANRTTPAFRETFGGAASGRVDAAGMTNPVIESGGLFRLTGGTGQVTLATRSYVLYYSTGTWIISCGGSGATPVAATIQVS